MFSMGFPGRLPEQCALAFVPLFSFYSVYGKKTVFVAQPFFYVMKPGKSTGLCAGLFGALCGHNDLIVALLRSNFRCEHGCGACARHKSHATRGKHRPTLRGAPCRCSPSHPQQAPLPVFANQPPDESQLSSDRWKVLQLGVDIVVDE